MHHNPEEFIGVDVGSQRIGLARGSSVARIAQPLKTVAAGNAIEEISKIPADGVVVGLPRGLNGQETDQTKLVRQWVESAKSHINKPFYWQDEALTSVAAHAKGAQQNNVDAVAASVILQDFLDTPVNQRVRC